MRWPARTRILLERVRRDFSSHGGVTHAAALAFYALFVLVPIPIFVVSGVAALVGDDVARAEVVGVLHALAGEQSAATLGQALETASELEGGWAARLFALVSLIFGATAFFVELQDALNKIWDAPVGGFEWRRFARSRLLSFLMVAASGTILLLLALAGVVTRRFGDRLAAALPRAALAFGVGGAIASLLVVWALCALIFRYVPDAEVSFRQVWSGSLATAALFMGGNELINLYLSYASVATVYGAAGSLVLTLIWIYWSALSFLLGAELTRALGERHAESSRRP